MADNLTIDALLTRGTARLKAESQAAADPGTGQSANPAFEAELLLSHALSKSRTELKTHPEFIPDAHSAHRFSEFLARRAAGEPIAYILGYRDFWTLRLQVNPAVLIPRPETELLVERSLTLGPKEEGRVLDLGTGSGAIALSLASERPAWTVTAIDTSGAALEVARANAAALGVKGIRFLEGHWFGALASGPSNPPQHFDLIVSNPPYVEEGDPALRDLRDEPQGALTSGPDGLSAIREIVREAPDYLLPQGWLLLEHGSTQAGAVARELVARGFGHVRSHRDLAGHERVTEAQWI